LEQVQHNYALVHGKVFLQIRQGFEQLVATDADFDHLKKAVTTFYL
jgi:hypothetical protein